ncbi:zinc finger, CCHC-type containing protein [Tanacetum coccineum]
MDREVKQLKKIRIPIVKVRWNSSHGPEYTWERDDQMERTCLCVFQFSLRDQASNWLERLPAGSITTWEDLTTRFLAQFFPPGRTVKLRNDILMFQQHHGESLSEAYTRFKDLIQKVPHHGLDLWLQIQIFYDHVDGTTQRGIDYAASGRLRKLRPDEA